MKKLNPLQAIRAFCLECVTGQVKEVEICPSENMCPLWAYRFGKNPYRKREISEEHKKKLRDNLRIGKNSPIELGEN